MDRALRESDRLSALKRLLVGTPLANYREPYERLNNAQALAVCSSDALSSVAYGTEEILGVLLLGGLGALWLAWPIALGVVTLLALVVVGYWQALEVYPYGGGAYTVARANLGWLAALCAAAAELINDILTVSVSIAVSVAALASLVPAPFPYRAGLGVALIGFIWLMNIRGLRQSGMLFSLPTYAFIGSVLALLGVGLWRLNTGELGVGASPSAIAPVTGQSIGVLLILTAFARGCSAITGAEVIFGQVRLFTRPEARNARLTLLTMGVLLGTLFLGLSLLALWLGVVPDEHEPVISQVARIVFDSGPAWILVQVVTALILILAANTSFADFPHLTADLAEDRFLPNVLRLRGDRLTFNSGIAALALLAMAPLVLLDAKPDLLLPLYGIGVFTGIALAEAGMLVHWVAHARKPIAAGIAALGMVGTGGVSVLLAIARFASGGWVLLVLMALMVALFLATRQHYAWMARAQHTVTPIDRQDGVARFIVPVADLNVGARHALVYARALAQDDTRVTAVHVSDDEEATLELTMRWGAELPKVALVIVESPYRMLNSSLLRYVEAVYANNPGDAITVVCSELVPSHWWEYLLHAQTTMRLKSTLRVLPGIGITSVPYRLE